MTKRVPWPEWAAPEREAILTATRRMKRAIDDTWQQGLSGRQNTELIQRALPFLEAQAQVIKIAVASIRQKPRPDGARFPQWARPVLDEAPIQADAVIEFVTQGSKEWGVGQNWEVLSRAFKFSHGAALRIEAMVDGIDFEAEADRTVKIADTIAD